MISYVNCESLLSDDVLQGSINFIEEYIKTNPCCNTPDICHHPHSQTDGKILDVDNYFMKTIKESYLYTLNKVFKKNVKIEKNRTWGYFNSEVKKRQWHNHLFDKAKKYKNHLTGENENYMYSGIIYLNDFKDGTIFETEDFIMQIKPKKFYWYLWPTEYDHTPPIFKSDNNRYVIATSTVFRLA